MVSPALYITETVSGTRYIAKNVKGKHIHDNIFSVYPLNSQQFVEDFFLIQNWYHYV